MDDDDRILSELNDPEWSQRVADIEREFQRADRRRRPAKALTGPARPRRRFRAGYIWLLIVIAVIAFAAIAKPWGVEQGPVYIQPDVHLTQAVDPAASGPADEPTG